MLEILGDGLKTLEAVDLTGSVRVGEIEALRSLAPVLRHATLAIGDAVTVAKKLSGDFPKLDTTVDKINAGQGTIGQLMVNPQLYESLNGTAKEMNSFMKDFRANPKKFLSIQLKLF